MTTLRVLLPSFLILSTLSPLLAQPAADDTKPKKRVGYEINVMPKGLKFSKESLYEEDEEVLQGFLGGPGDDIALDAENLPTSRQFLIVGFVSDAAGFLPDVPRAKLQGMEEETTGGAYVLFFDERLRQAQKVIFLPANIEQVRRIKVAKEGLVVIGAKTNSKTTMVYKFDPLENQLIWKREVESSIVDMSMMKDDSVLVLTGGGHVHRLKPDGSGTIPFGDQPSLRIFGAEYKRAYWQGLGYSTHKDKYRGGGKTPYGVGATSDMGIITVSMISVGARYGPDFEPILMRWNLDGKAEWATHLCEALPSESDHKMQRLWINPKNDDIIVSSLQHGHFSNNLKAPGGYISNSALEGGWMTGDIMIGWVGKVDPKDGEVKKGTFFFPKLREPSAEKGMKATANSLFPNDLRTDDDGNIYMIGRSAWKFEHTKFSFQPQIYSGSFLAVFEPDLSNVIHSGTIFGGKGFSAQAHSIAISSIGPVVVGSTQFGKNGPKPPFEVISANHDKTNYLKDKLISGRQGKRDIMIGLYPSFNWFLFQ